MFVTVNSSTKNIALLLFSRRAEAESQAKQWFGGRRRRDNLRLARALLTHTRQAVATTGLPVFHIHEALQQGETFGERLSTAYAGLFAQGYEAVIAVGNDSPELHHADWCFIIQELEAGRCVLGPSRRGGAYLIGLTKTAFRQKAFQQLPWQTNTLYASLKVYCQQAAKTSCLPENSDLNTISDIRFFYKKNKTNNRLQLLLSALLQPTNTPEIHTLHPTRTLHQKQLRLRAPPAW